MADEGYLTDAEAEQWKQHPLPESRHGTEVGQVAPYFVEWVRTQLETRYGMFALQQRPARPYIAGPRHAARRAGRHGQRAGTALRAHRDTGTPRTLRPWRTRTGEKPTETPYLQGMFIAMEPAPAKSAHWSAAGISVTRSSTAPRRRCGSRAPRSSPSFSTPPSTRRARVADPVRRAGHDRHAGRQRVLAAELRSRFPRSHDHARRAQALHEHHHRADGCGHRARDRVAQTAREFGLRTTRSSVSVHAHRRGGRDPHAACRSVHRLCERRLCRPRPPDPARRGCRRPCAVGTAAGGRAGRESAGRGHHAGPHVHRAQQRHRLSGPGPEPGGPALRGAGGRQDRHDERQYRCLVCGLHAGPGGRGLVRLRPAAPDHEQRGRRPAGSAGVGAVHARPLHGRLAGVATPAAWSWPEGIVVQNVDIETGRLANEYCPNNVVTRSLHCRHGTVRVVQPVPRRPLRCAARGACRWTRHAAGQPPANPPGGAPQP
jgi:hypothetical protein